MSKGLVKKKKAAPPHPNSPAAKHYDWSAIGIPHHELHTGWFQDFSKYQPNSPAAQHVVRTTQPKNLTIQQSRVLEACKKCYKFDLPCNFFTGAVAEKLLIDFPPGDADHILAYMDDWSHSWHRLTKEQAVEYAQQGAFIVAGIKSSESGPKHDGIKENGKKITHGHVCVVIPGWLNDFPRVVSTRESYEGDTQPEAGRSAPDNNSNFTMVFARYSTPYVRYYAAPADKFFQRILDDIDGHVLHIPL